jgi:ribosome-associated protein
VRAIRNPRDRIGSHKRLPSAAEVLDFVQSCLDDDKAESIVVIDLAGKTDIADYMVIASGRAQRHVGAIAEHLLERLKGLGAPVAGVEGLARCDWVLIDAGDVVVHVFRPEVRRFYNLEKMWGMELSELTSPEPVPRAGAGSDLGSRAATV